MFSNLAFIDWIALIFAAILLAAAAAAAIVAYATAKSRPVRNEVAGGHSPRHAASPNGAAVAGNDVAKAQHATTTPQHAATPRVGRATSDDPTHNEARVGSGSAVLHDGVLVEPTAARLESEKRVAARAAKLRNRPVPDHPRAAHKRIVSTVEPKRMPAHAPNRAFAEERDDSNRLTIGMDSTDGFAARTPGFFEDPVGRHELRYWDGHRWTEYVKEHGERFTDPL